jgi:endoglucanase
MPKRMTKSAKRKNANAMLFRIKARANGKFVSAQNSGDGPLAAVRDRVDIWEEFSLIKNPEDGTVSLRARANGKLVAADLNQAGRLVARSDMVQQWEKFQMEPKEGGATGNEGSFTLKARANGKFVVVDRANQVLVGEVSHIHNFTFGMAGT